MKRLLFSTLLLLLLGISISAQTTNKSVEKTDAYYADIAEKARLAETDDDRGQFGDLVVNEVNINSRHHQWRAVGIYGQVFKFFYYSLDTERHMYPDQLVMVKAERHESSRNYAEEYLYSKIGTLIYYSQKVENDDQAPADQKIYISGIRAIRFIDDGKVRDKLNSKDTETVKEIIEQSRKVKEIFVKSINL